MDKMILPYRGKAPVIDPTVFLAPMAAVIGDVTIGAGSSVWFGAVVRGDFQPITIGQNTNIQDNATIHVMRDVPVHIGNNVLIGHNAVVHCSRVGDNTLIGMGSGQAHSFRSIRRFRRTRLCSAIPLRSCAHCVTMKSKRCRRQQRTMPILAWSTNVSLRS